MNLDELKNRSILLLGKSRAFSTSEFEDQMRFHDITVVTEYNEDVVLAVEGKMMTPYEQMASDELYESKKAKTISIDLLETELAKHIDEETLLMSLKLSHDKERLKSFLQNSCISDGLFLKLLSIYSWGGEDFFENDDNRDVTAALISRFYKNIERNHNVQYATSGLMHLIVQCRDEKLIESISVLEPIQKCLNGTRRDANYIIVTAIATHFLTPKTILKMLIKKSNSYVKTLIAMRDDCDSAMQKVLYEDRDEDVLFALTHNTNLDKKIAKEMMKDERYTKSIAKHILLDDELFELLAKKYRVHLAKNPSISHDMQKSLIACHEVDIQLALASNIHIDEEIISALISEGSEDVSLAIYANSSTPKESLEEAYENKLNHFALSNNENTPQEILRKLANSEDERVLRALAKNVSTPIEVLYQLQLDSRFERSVKENPAFGNHIQSENIGWQL